LANGGTVYRPHVLREVVSATGEVVHRPPAEVVRKLDVNPAHLRLLRESARRVVTIGHAWMPNAKLPIAGKTGTAEFGAGERVDASGKRIFAYHNWFVSFLPKQDNAEPTAEIAMVIFAYNSSIGCQTEVCLNPAVGMTQRVYETYMGGMAKPAQPGR
jgi:penicillin-binding protein 2